MADSDHEGVLWRNLRDARSLARGAVAEGTGLSVAQVGRIESTGRLSLPERDALALFYGESPSEGPAPPEKDDSGGIQEPSPEVPAGQTPVGEGSACATCGSTVDRLRHAFAGEPLCVDGKACLLRRRRQLIEAGSRPASWYERLIAGDKAAVREVRQCGADVSPWVTKLIDVDDEDEITEET